MVNGALGHWCVGDHWCIAGHARRAGPEHTQVLEHQQKQQNQQNTTKKQKQHTLGGLPRSRTGPGGHPHGHNPMCLCGLLFLSPARESGAARNPERFFVAFLLCFVGFVAFCWFSGTWVCSGRLFFSCGNKKRKPHRHMDSHITMCPHGSKAPHVPMWPPLLDCAR